MMEDKHGSYHAIPIQTGSIALRIKVEDFGKHSLLPLLNVFGKLYYGTVNKEYFDQLFQEKKQQFLEQLNSPTATTEKFSDFRLRMTRLALNEKWKWPACINVVRTAPEWATGGGRLLATGLCKKNPEQELTVLFFDQVGVDVKQWVADPIEVTSDQQLHDLLGVPYTPTQSSAIQLSAVLRQIGDRTCLFLHGVIDDELEGYQNSQETSNLTTLKKLQTWQELYPAPQLKIYTDWPDLITDSLNIWNYQIVGNIAQFSHQLYNPGHLERLARTQHEEHSGNSHVLFIKQPRLIDLSEFLIWVDNEHTTFINQDWDFLLYRRDTEYKTKMISFSSI
jgi:hypothetical protein